MKKKWRQLRGLLSGMLECDLISPHLIEVSNEVVSDWGGSGGSGGWGSGGFSQYNAVLLKVRSSSLLVPVISLSQIWDSDTHA